MLAEMQVFEQFVKAVRAGIAPELEATFEERVVESRFALERIAADLERLPASARILEIGAGTFLLAAALAGAGRDVTALEPLQGGFDYFRRVQDEVVVVAASRGFAFQRLSCGIEDIAEDSAFDYAFSWHVFEHLPHPGQALACAYRSLRPGGVLFVACPNFAFPYEGHFSVPNLGSKALTFRVFGRRIARHARFDDPMAVWRSLNWISASRLADDAARLPGARIRFRTHTFQDLLERAVSDPVLAGRHPAWVVGLCRMGVALGVHRLTHLLGWRWAPLIEAHVTKASPSPGGRAA